MTIPFTDDELSSERECCVEDRGPTSDETAFKQDNKAEFKADITLRREETAQYYIKPDKTCFGIIDYKYMDMFLKLITWLMIVIITRKKSRYNGRKLQIDLWYRKVRKKCPFEQFTDWYCKPNKWILDNMVKPFHYIPQYIYTACPFFPDKYDSFIKDGKQKQKEEIMKFEAARLSTFSTFPSSVGVFATRLASAGFYYDGNGDEVICFSCGIKYSNWQKHDSPMDIHRKLSPQCSFVLDMMNKTGIGPNLTHPITGSDNKHDSHRHGTGACGNTSDTVRTHDGQNGKDISNRFGDLNNVQNTNITSDSGSVMTSSTTLTSPISTTSISHSSNDVNSLIRIPTRNSNTNQSANSHNNTTNEASNPNGILGMGVCIDKPKYPRYAIRSVRLDSFITWPGHLTQSPEELSCAGFFFTGIEDHCRCFYCGGGLRHWETEDQPWIEHARWFQHCPFVRQCKGDKFIEDVISGRQITSENEGNKQQTTPRTPNSIQNDFLNNPAVQLISEFGYDSGTMKKAYDSLVKSGCKDITATSLLERIFMQEPTNRSQIVDKGQQLTTQSREANEPIKSNSQMTPTGDPDLELSIKSLEEENQNLRDQQTCKICLDEPVAIVFLPCGHMAACLNCSPALRRCPICRAFIKGTVKAIMC